MSKKSPTDRLSEGFVPSGMPPMDPEGGLLLEPAPVTPIAAAPISICELGPCRNYHALASELDAQQPLDGSKSRLPVFEIRACYPIAGIEIELTHAVRECSRWEPQTKTELEVVTGKRNRFVDTNTEKWVAFGQSWQTPNTDTKEGADGER